MLISGKQLVARILYVLFCLALVFLAACSGSGTSNSTAQSDLKAPLEQQVYRTEGAVLTLDPALGDDLGSLQAIGMVFTGLVTLDDNFKIQPQMAASWDLDPDGLTWTFHLKPNLTFSDGTPLTSTDIAESIDRALQPSTHSPDCLTFLGIIQDANLVAEGKIPSLVGQSILTPDDHTLTIVTTKKAPYFLDNLTEACAFPVEPKLIQKYGVHFTEHLNEGGGNGPFIVSYYNPTHGIDFVPNPNYFGPRPQLRKVTIAFYVDYDSSYRGYQLGQVDMTPIPIGDIQIAQKNDLEYHQLFQLQSYFFLMNYLTKPFDDIKIRQAFALAINRNYIAQYIFHGLVTPTYHLIPQGMPGYNPGLTGPAGVTDTSGNPTLAKMLLKEGLHEEGWSSVSQMPPITITYSGYPGDQVIDEAISMWQTELGVKVSPNPIDPRSGYSTFLNLTNGTTNNPNGLQMWANGWGVIYIDPRAFTTQIFGKNEINNMVNYGQNNSPAAAEQQSVQNDLEAADINFNMDQRYQEYNQAERKLVNDVAWMPIYQYINMFLLKSYVKGLLPSGRDKILTIIPPDDWARVFIAAH